MRVVVTGAGGQLGHDVVLACRAAGDDVHGFDRHALDVTSRDAFLGAVTALRPDAVIHTAAWTAVDACESDSLRAFAPAHQSGQFFQTRLPMKRHDAKIRREQRAGSVNLPQPRAFRELQPGRFARHQGEMVVVVDPLDR